MNRRALLSLLCAMGAAAIAPAAAARTALSVGYQKVAHLAPMMVAAEALRKAGIDLRLVELLRYADARQALESGTLDIASAGPVDLAISIAGGSNQIVGLMGTGTSPKYVIGRNGASLDNWNDIRGKKIAVAPGSAVWLQFAATLKENNIPYNSFDAVNIQSGGAAFDLALDRGEVDAIVTWEPFESLAVMRGYGFAAIGLDYSMSHAVGAGLGVLLANRAAAAAKRAAVEAFVKAYVEAMRDLSASPERFAQAIARLTGIEPAITSRMAQLIKLTPEIEEDQLRRQAKVIHELGLTSRDVSGEISQAWDQTFITRVLK